MACIGPQGHRKRKILKNTVEKIQVSLQKSVKNSDDFK